VINTTHIFGMPPVCRTQFEGLSLLQYAGLTEAVSDLEFDPEDLDRKLRLILGGNWSANYDFARTLRNDYVVFEHIRCHSHNDLEIIAIKSTSTVPDALFTFWLSTMHHLPEQLFQMIPFATVLFNPLLKMLTGVTIGPVDVYSPTSLASFYIAPIQEYIETFLRVETRMVLIGSSVGGAVAKAVGMQFGMKAIAFNSPEIGVRFVDNFTSAAWDVSWTHDVIIPGQKYTGRETGGVIEYIPYDSFPLNPTPTAGTICLLAIECQLFEHFKEYCESYIARDQLWTMRQNAPFR
jgi:hypothetical protein